MAKYLVMRQERDKLVTVAYTDDHHKAGVYLMEESTEAKPLLLFPNFLVGETDLSMAMAKNLDILEPTERELELIERVVVDAVRAGIEMALDGAPTLDGIAEVEGLERLGEFDTTPGPGSWSADPDDRGGEYIVKTRSHGNWSVQFSVRPDGESHELR